MKIFSTAQIRQWDRFTIEGDAISSSDLMEWAAACSTRWILENLDHTHYRIVCGTGNNGGDGLAIARQLFFAGLKVRIDIAGDPKKGSVDFIKNYAKLPGEIVVTLFDHEEAIPLFDEQEIIIDCLVGSGISGQITGWKEVLIERINHAGCSVVAIDLPSGFVGDQLGIQGGAIIRADITLTFQVPKIAFLFPENFQYVGNFFVLDIGLKKEFHENNPVEFFYSEEKEMKGLLKERSKFAHKNSFGHLQIMAGSYGKMGAAVLCARGALRTGCGVLTATIPKCGYEIFQAAIPEAMCETDEENSFLHHSIPDNLKSSCVAGPGIGKTPETAAFLRKLLTTIKIPLVLDADALNIIAINRWEKYLPAGTILTPHPGEFDRLFGPHHDSFVRLETMRYKARVHGIYIILKGAHTAIACPDGEVHFNSTGNSGMATAGSGDVLAGMIGSLLAQGHSPLNASRLGVYLHGLAGDMVMEKAGIQGILAGDIAENIPSAIKKLHDH